jgi:hypothetical protein
VVSLYKVNKEDLLWRGSLPKLFGDRVFVINLMEEVSWRYFKSKGLIGTEILSRVENHVGIFINTKTIPLQVIVCFKIRNNYGQTSDQERRILMLSITVISNW